MFSRLSTTSRIIVLQVGIIVSAILAAGVMLKVSGHGRHEAEIRAIEQPGYRPPGLATWTRDKGWMLFALPIALAVHAVRRRRRFGDDYESADLVIIGFVIAAGLFLLAFAAGIQPLISTTGIVKVNPARSTGSKP